MMIDATLALDAISLGLLFVALVTKAYTRSYTTAICVFCYAIAVQVFKVNAVWAMYIMSLGLVICLARAILQHRRDRWIVR